MLRDYYVRVRGQLCRVSLQVLGLAFIDASVVIADTKVKVAWVLVEINR